MSSSNEYLLPFFFPPALPAAPNCSKFSLDLVINEVEALCAEKWVVPVESNESDAAYFVPTRFRMPTTSVGDILEIAHCLLKPGRLLGINLLVSPLWRKYVISLIASHMLIPVSDTIFKANTSLPYFRAPYPKPGGMYLAFVCALKTQAPVKITSSSCRLIRSSEEVSANTIEAIQKARSKYNADRLRRLQEAKERAEMSKLRKAAKKQAAMEAVSIG